MAMINAPAMWLSRVWLLCSVCTSPTVPSPSRMKMNEKLAMNVSAGGMTLRHPARSSSDGVIPVIADR
jgi:hypothetical protein